jgi:hypothetical protein
MANTPPDFNPLVMKLLPPGSHPTLGEMRRMLNKALTEQVNLALKQQREANFPELIATKQYLEEQETKNKKEVEQWRISYQNKQTELAKHEQNLQTKENQILASEKRLATLLQAFAAYMAWLDGAGEVDENGKRFNALRTAYTNFKRSK